MIYRMSPPDFAFTANCLALSTSVNLLVRIHGDCKGRPEVLNSWKRYIYEIVAMYKTIATTREVVGVTDYSYAWYSRWYVCQYRTTLQAKSSYNTTKFSAIIDSTGNSVSTELYHGFFPWYDSMQPGIRTAYY